MKSQVKSQKHLGKDAVKDSEKGTLPRFQATRGCKTNRRKPARTNVPVSRSFSTSLSAWATPLGRLNLSLTGEKCSFDQLFP